MSLRRKIYEVIEVADKDDRDSLIYDRFMLVCIAAVCVLAGGYIALSALIMFQVEPTALTRFSTPSTGRRHADDRRLWRHLSDERDWPHREHDVVVHGNRHRCAAHRYHYGGLHARAQP